MTMLAVLIIQLFIPKSQCALLDGGNDAEVSLNLQEISGGQVQLDMEALQIAYQSSFLEKIMPGLYATQASKDILELHNSAKFALANAEQTSAYNLAAYVCFLEPETDGCATFNDLGCSESGKCDSGVKSNMRLRKSEMVSLCKEFSTTKTVSSNCFIVSLRQAADGTSRDSFVPWNHAVQKWMDSHNCTSLMYHLKYRCYSNLIKWDEVHAEEEYVDLDTLFDSVFGLNAIASFHEGKRFECSSMNLNDRRTLVQVAKIRVDVAILNFVSTAATLAHYGLSAADITYRRKGYASAPMMSVQDKLRIILVVNLLYDAGVEPVNLLCCSLDACSDYHPLDAFVKKAGALIHFYPGGGKSLATKASEFSNSVQSSEKPADYTIKAMDSYIYNVLDTAPMEMAYQASSGDEIGELEAF